MEFDLLAKRVVELEKKVDDLEKSRDKAREKIKKIKNMKREAAPATPMKGGKTIPKADEYRKFVSSVNEQQFMKKFKGKGKRKIQSLLYELKNDIREDGLKAEIFNDFLGDLSMELEEYTFKNITDRIIDFRKNFNWVNPTYQKSRKKID